MTLYLSSQQNEEESSRIALDVGLYRKTKVQPVKSPSVRFWQQKPVVPAKMNIFFLVNTGLFPIVCPLMQCKTNYNLSQFRFIQSE